MVLAGESLGAVAKSIGLKLEVRETGFFTKEQGPQELAGLSPENTAILFDLAVNATTQSPMAMADGYLFATKREQAPESVTPLETVKEQIVASIRKEEALKLAKAAADADLALLAKGEAPAKLTPKESEPFGRMGSIPGLGVNQMFITQAFQAEAGTWLPESYVFPDGYVLAKAVKVTPPETADWDAEKALWMNTLNQRSEEQAVQAFASDLRAKADVRVTNPAMIEN